MVRRAREHLAAGRPRFAASPEDQRRLTEQFAVAATTGDEMIGPWPPTVWGGTVTVTTYSVTTSVSVAAISLP